MIFPVLQPTAPCALYFLNLISISIYISNENRNRRLMDVFQMLDPDPNSLKSSTT